MKKIIVIASLFATLIPSITFAYESPMQIADRITTFYRIQGQVLGASTETQLGTGNCYTFQNNLEIGSAGPDVMFLHRVLALEGFQVNKNASMYDQATAAAVSGYQLKYPQILSSVGLSHPTGSFWNSTRAHVNSLYGCK